MSATGLEVFDKTLQTTNIWLDEIMEEMGPDRQIAWHILGTVLRTLRDRLPVDLAAHLGAQLPILVRGVYYDQFRPSSMPHKERSLEEFLQEIQHDFESLRPIDAGDAFRVVCGVLNRHVEGGQMAKVWDALPEDIRKVPEPNRNPA